MKTCNTLAGAKIFGFQTEESSYNCDNDKLLKNDIQSKNVDRTIISVGLDARFRFRWRNSTIRKFWHIFYLSLIMMISL
jgi:hypothetical protein